MNSQDLSNATSKEPAMPSNKERLEEIIQDVFDSMTEFPAGEVVIRPFVNAIIAANLLAPEWVSVKERLPDHNGLVPVAVLLEGETELICTFDRFEDGEWEDLGTVTLFWFDLPELPQPPKESL